MKMEQKESSEMLAFKLRTLVSNAEESICHSCFVFVAVKKFNVGKVILLHGGITDINVFCKI
jgi:hypothetical protein